jgi:membrane-associated phospholipid phosphatase
VRSDTGRMRRIGRTLTLVAASIAVGELTSWERGRRLDLAAFRAVNRGHGPAADVVFSALTELGSLWAAAAASATILAGGYRRTAVRTAAIAGGTWLVGQGMKRAIGRPRPYESDPSRTRRLIGRPPQSSWPSSHAAVFAAYATVLGRDLGVGAPTRRCLDALAWAVAASRVYLGVHYPSDVVSGVLLGRALADAMGEDRAADTLRS